MQISNLTPLETPPEKNQKIILVMIACWIHIPTPSLKIANVVQNHLHYYCNRHYKESCRFPTTSTGSVVNICPLEVCC